MDAALALRTERLDLRPLGPDDLDDLAALFADADAMHYLGPPRTREQTAEALAVGAAHWAARGYGIWAVFERATGRFAGRCGLRWLDDAGDVELLYTYFKPYWGRGIGTEAAAAAARFGFERVGLGRLIALADPANVGSWRVMEKLGMRREKVAPYKGAPAVWYALTPLDFAARRGDDVCPMI